MSLVQISRTIAAGVFLAGMSLAQQTSQDTIQPALHVQTDLVVVPFQVRRGSRSVSDLKPSDFVLLEDGVPRAFTGFEAPSDHLSLDLVVMFDVSGEPEGFLSGKVLHDMVGYWNETIARILLEEPGATIRISVYQFDRFRLRRLSRPSSDPRELLAALRRLTDPIPSGQGFDFQLPKGVVIRRESKDAEPTSPWSLLGAMTVLGDSAAGPTMPARALVLFSPGAEGTSITPQDLADEGFAANVPIYPVVLPANQWIWYEGYSHPMLVNGQLMQYGICSAPPPERGSIDCPLNTVFASVGNSTGGRSFEASRRALSDPTPGADNRGLSRFSMTGAQVNDILTAVKRHALARFASSYTLWFAPSPSASPRQHKLEVRLAAKSDGKIDNGKRRAIY